MHTLKSALSHFLTLKKRDEFVHAAKSGEKWVAKGFILQAVRAEHDNVQIGYTVSKKVFKSAVKRNRIKRRLRAVAADVLSQEAKTGYDYVLIGRTAAIELPYETLCKDLRWCLKKLEVLK